MDYGGMWNVGHAERGLAWANIADSVLKAPPGGVEHDGANLWGHG